MWNVVVLMSSWVCCCKASVTYDHKAIIVNGQRKFLISGSIHYPRSTPEMCHNLFRRQKKEVWMSFRHMFSGMGMNPNLAKGFPVWLKYVPGISFRTDNGPFKAAMQKFTTKIVNMMKAERLYESHGGPIILSQVENEYGPMEYELGAPGRAYSKWAADMAVGLGPGVPWVMCKQDDAPDPIVTDIVGGTIRWRRYLDYLILQLCNNERTFGGMEPLLLQVASDAVITELMNKRSNSKIIISSHVKGKNPSKEKLGNLIALPQSTGADIIKLMVDTVYITDVAPIFHILTHSQCWNPA